MKRAIVTSGLSLLLVLLGQASAMSELTLRDILTATHGEPHGFAADATFSRVGIDSRTIQPGELFWALRGEQHDGHDFAAAAVANGAAGCVVDHPIANSGPAIVVPDTLQALWDLAGRHRDRHDAVVIGVTGSFGKTTTREMIHAILSAGHCGLQSPKNYNNHVGVPLTLLELTTEHEFAVIELGASAVGEIRALAELSKPEIGVLTGIGPAHLDGFGSLDGVIAGKSELVEMLPESGFLVANGDDPLVRRIAETARCPVIFAGRNDNNQVRAEAVRVQPGLIRFQINGREYCVEAVGEHHVTAAAIAIAIGREIGLSEDAIADGLAGFTSVAGRCRLQSIGPWTVIDDTYNSNPASLRAACVTLRDWPADGRRILVSGDMLELGATADDSHREAGRFAAESHIDLIIACGDHAGRFLAGAKAAGMHTSQLAICDNLDTLRTILDCWLEPGDVVLVKGSRASRMERAIDELKQLARTNEEKTARPLLRASA